ncbi:hypothetical protein Pcinc_007243 [Petrolisthes cinctipes]|uniref:Uncharacterized protein n=1 Tax=Petrolisthes cinctipes TaxID=88211 RepID=A0AAE1GBH7_PETCI|nr:hypothetical protein Pcinc_007243 [Petrolisthes cinctipes]
MINIKAAKAPARTVMLPLSLIQIYSGPTTTTTTITTTTTTMKLLLLLSCLAVLALASPLPRPQERTIATINAVIREFLGGDANGGILDTFIPDITKTIPCGVDNAQTCLITIGVRRISSTGPTTTTMKVLLLLLLSCLAALALASPLPRPQQNDPRLFLPDTTLLEGLFNNFLGLNNNKDFLNTLLGVAEKPLLCDPANGQEGLCKVPMKSIKAAQVCVRTTMLQLSLVQVTLRPHHHHHEGLVTAAVVPGCPRPGLTLASTTGKGPQIIYSQGSHRCCRQHHSGNSKYLRPPEHTHTWCY